MTERADSSQSSAGCMMIEETDGVQGQKTGMMTGFRFTLEKCLQCVELIHRETLMAMNGSQPLSYLSQQMEATGSLTRITMGRTW